MQFLRVYHSRRVLPPLRRHRGLVRFQAIDGLQTLRVRPAKEAPNAVGEQESAMVRSLSFSSPLLT